MHLYNSLSQKIEKFQPIKKNSISMYVCGITPYDTTHLGHAFTYVSFDVLYRYLTHAGYSVNYTQNVTDIDDDILKRAKETKKDWKELGEYWTKRFLKDLKSLNVIMPTHYVKATNSIEKIIEITQVHLQKKIAYEKNGNVYFSVDAFKKYGALSKLSKKEMFSISQQRGNNTEDPLKINPLDFVLWQKSKKDEPSWKSPWGNGRPGWHIECSAMIHQYLGEQIDIHGGGEDLKFPHHESEIAQSESFTEKNPFVSYWMHTAMVKHEKEKMSKSLGNLIMVSDLLKKYDANAIRWYLLSHHYREIWEYNENDLKKAAATYKDIMKACYVTKEPQTQILLPKNFKEEIESDLNTPAALAYLKKLAQKVIKDNDRNIVITLRSSLETLGFAL